MRSRRRPSPESPQLSSPATEGPAWRPTLAHVAELAGVSIATVSRALNGSPRVLPETRALVEEAVAQLGYVPNPAARSLVTGRTSTIALVVSEPEDRLFSDPFFAAVVHGISSAIADGDLQLVLLLAHTEREHVKVERYVRQGHVDGVILMSLHGDDPLPRGPHRAVGTAQRHGRPDPVRRRRQPRRWACRGRVPAAARQPRHRDGDRPARHRATPVPG